MFLTFSFIIVSMNILFNEIRRESLELYSIELTFQGITWGKSSLIEIFASHYPVRRQEIHQANTQSTSYLHIYN